MRGTDIYKFSFANRLRIACLCIGILMSACTKDGDSLLTETTSRSFKVAVIMQQGEQARWERTAKWALENIALSQGLQPGASSGISGIKDKVELQLTFKCQDDSDILEYMQQVAEDTTVVAIVGPTTSAYAEQMAIALSKSKTGGKPMITPSATQVEYQRRFANVPYVWNMAESDIAQLEVLLSAIASISKTDSYVMLLAADDNDGDSRNAYVEWFGFIAEEYGLDVGGVYLYKNEDDLRRYTHELCGTDWRIDNNYLIFYPSSNEMAIAFDDEIGLMKAQTSPSKYFYTPFIFCSDTFVSERIAKTVKNATFEGVDLYALPESGFNKAYHQRFGEELVNGEAQFYDALCLVAYAATLSMHQGISLNDAILAVVDGCDGTGGSWLPADMSRNFEMLSQGRTPDIDGVSSSWLFDEKTHASVCSSTYRRWRLYEGQYLTTEYLSTNGSRRTTSTKNTWEWTASQMQSFSTEETYSPTYPALDDRWALLIAASRGWANYRFQSDVFCMYQLLKQHGYQDDHIVLICQDDLARHANNPYQGQLYVSVNGTNVYEASAIDYRLSDLRPADIADILQGRRSEKLKQVISADDDDNVLIFWSSHGVPGSLDFGGSESMTYERMRGILADTPHRKLLFAVEACYSGGMGQYCEGLPGCLFITAANPYETSHADVWSNEVGVYLSNGFTRGFQEAIESNPAISLRDLYYTVARNTSGSHVKVYNAHFYGSVYNNTMAEFLTQ